MNKLQLTSDILLSEDDLQKGINAGALSVYTEEGIANMRADIQKAAKLKGLGEAEIKKANEEVDEFLKGLTRVEVFIDPYDIEKAKNYSRLAQRRITDKNGVSRIVWVKVHEDPKTGKTHEQDINEGDTVTAKNKAGKEEEGKVVKHFFSKDSPRGTVRVQFKDGSTVDRSMDGIHKKDSEKGSGEGKKGESEKEKKDRLKKEYLSEIKNPKAKDRAEAESWAELHIRSEKRVAEKKMKELESQANSLKVGEKIKGTEGNTKGRVGTVIEIHQDGEGAVVDFGNGDKYGILFSRLKSGEFKKVSDSKPKDKDLNEFGAHKGYLNFMERHGEKNSSRKPFAGTKMTLSDLGVDRFPSKLNEQEKRYFDKLPVYNYEEVPKHNPNRTADKENYIIQTISGDKFFVDAQGYEYPRYIIPLEKKSSEKPKDNSGGKVKVLKQGVTGAELAAGMAKKGEKKSTEIPKSVREAYSESVRELKGWKNRAKEYSEKGYGHSKDSWKKQLYNEAWSKSETAEAKLSRITHNHKDIKSIASKLGIKASTRRGTAIRGYTTVSTGYEFSKYNPNVIDFNGIGEETLNKIASRMKEVGFKVTEVNVPSKTIGGKSRASIKFEQFYSVKELQSEE